MLLMGKSTISTGPLSIAMLVYQRVHHLIIGKNLPWASRCLSARAVEVQWIPMPGEFLREMTCENGI